MSRPARYAYLHGFGSGPRAKKGVALAEALSVHGIELLLPDLNAPSFAKLSPLAVVERVKELWESVDRAPLRLVGSSLGGYAAARFSELFPEAVERAVLYCPGFELSKIWPRVLSPEALERWQKRGSLPFPNEAGKFVDVHHGFLEEAAQIPPWPRIQCPTRMVHGTADIWVPIEQSRRYRDETPTVVDLIELEDGHELMGKLPDVLRVTLEHFGLDHRPPA